jgi:hypothetical protein
MKEITPEHLKQISDLANTVAEEYRTKCFELLLSHALGPLNDVEDVTTKPTSSQEQKPNPPSKPFVIHINVKAFLSQFSLDDSKIWKLFFAEGSEVVPVYTIDTVKKSIAQIRITLLLALQQALTTGQFQTQMDTVRQKCTDLKFYDASNFKANYKNNKKLFKTISDDEPLVLTPEGKSELADLIEELTQNDG